MVNLCGNYPNDQFCYCQTSLGKNKNIYRYFNTSSQKFFCCQEVNSTPSEIVKALENNNETITPFATVSLYLQKIDSLNLGNCNYSRYLGGSDEDQYLEENYNYLYQNAKANMTIFNNFFQDGSSNIPTFEDYQITCDSFYTPYMIHFKPTIEDVFDKTYYICSKINNNIFPNLDLDYSIQRFYLKDLLVLVVHVELQL